MQGQLFADDVGEEKRPALASEAAADDVNQGDGATVDGCQLTFNLNR